VSISNGQISSMSPCDMFSCVTYDGYICLFHKRVTRVNYKQDNDFPCDISRSCDRGCHTGCMGQSSVNFRG